MSKSVEELWGLVDRNSHRLGVTQINEDPAFMSDEGIFFGSIAEKNQNSHKANQQGTAAGTR